MQGSISKVASQVQLLSEGVHPSKTNPALLPYQELLSNYFFREKAAYIQEVLKAEGPTSSTRAETSDNEEDYRCISASIPPSNSSSQTPSVQPFFREMTNEKISQLHELLLKSLLSSNIPLAFLENPYFQEYQSELARSPYTPGDNSWHLVSSAIVYVCPRTLQEVFNMLTLKSMKTC